MNRFLTILLLIVSVVQGSIIVGAVQKDNVVTAPTQQVYTATVTPSPIPTYTETVIPTQTQQVALVVIVPDTAVPFISNEVIIEQQAVYVEPTQYVQNTEISTLPVVPTFDYNQDIDSAWDLYATPNPTLQLQTLSQPQCVYPLPIPFISWDTALGVSSNETVDGQNDYDRIIMLSSTIATYASTGGAYFPTEGTVNVSEDTVTAELKHLYFSGYLHGCYDANNNPNAYGVGVQMYLDWLKGFIINE